MPILNDQNIFLIGKYRNEKTLDQVFQEDPKYITWLKNQPWTIEDDYFTAELAKLPILETAPIADNVMTWGKYKDSGKTLDEIFAFDPSYISWLKKNPWVKENSPKLVEQLQKYVVLL